MKHLSGKKLEITMTTGEKISGLCTGGTDDMVKIMADGSKDETFVFIRNIFAYTIIGGGVAGGYSGLKVYLCKNADIGCQGRVKLSIDDETIASMGCNVINADTAAGRGFNCDFGCLGPMEVIPSNVQRVLFDKMLTIKNRSKNERIGGAGKPKKEDR